MIDPSWLKWIKLSIAKYVISNSSGYKIWVEDDENSTLENYIANEAKWIELRISTSSIRPQTEVETELDILIQIMCAFKSNNSVSDRHAMAGYFASLMTNSIQILKLGPDVTDDKSVFGCIQLRSDIERPIDIINWGIMNPEDKIAYTSIESMYRFYL